MSGKVSVSKEGPVATVTLSNPGKKNALNPKLLKELSRAFDALAGENVRCVILRGEIGHKNFWLLDPKTGAERQLTDLPSKFALGDFDISGDGKEIIFDRVQDSSSLALFELTR